MDKEKEGLSRSAQEAIATAAKANVDAVAEVISSAATAFMDALLKPSPKKRRRGSSKKKAASAHPSGER
jgi:hypothetical protein